MGTLTAGARAKVLLSPGRSLRVTAPGTAVVSMRFGGPEGDTTITAGTQTFGPYDVQASLSVTATSGSVSYEEIDYQPPVLALPASSVQRIAAHAVYSRAGTLSVPLGSIVASTGALFTLPGWPLVFPANSLSAGDTFEVCAYARKRGANATAALRVLLGTNNATTDGIAAEVSMTNADKRDACIFARACITPSGALANASIADGGQATDVFRDLSFSLASPVYLNLAIASASASDSFDVLAAQVWLHKAL